MSEDIRKKAALEAVLFAMGESVELKKLAEVIEEEPAKTKELLDSLIEKYKSEEFGIELISLESAYQFVTKPAYFEELIKIAKTPRKLTLSDSVLETLSIVAYKQPVTKLEIETIRGVSCEYAINRLLEYELIEELGRKDAPGRPILFGTTEQFLRSFGVKSLKDLPEMDTLQIEEFKQQAEQEVQLTLKI